MAPSSGKESAVNSFVAGGFGGICEVLVGHPLDLIKVRFQTGVKTSSRSMSGALSGILQREGVLGLFRGVSAPLVAIASINAVTFWGYETGKIFIRSLRDDNNNNNNDDDDDFTVPELAAAAAFSALPTNFVTTPTERVKCLLQTTDRSRFRGMYDCAKHVMREGGLASLFRGFYATLLRDTPGNVVWFVTYEVTKKQLKTRMDALSSIVVAGAAAGVAYATVSVPIDVIKSRIQAAPMSMYQGGITEVYRERMRKEGPKAFLRGMGPAVARAIPAYSSCFLGMELMRSFLNSNNNSTPPIIVYKQQYKEERIS